MSERDLMGTPESLAEFICWWQQPDPHFPLPGGCAYHRAMADQIEAEWLPAYMARATTTPVPAAARDTNRPEGHA